MRNRCLSIVVAAVILVCYRPVFAAETLTVDNIVGRMMAHNEWQDAYLTEYIALRTFYAENARFKADATLLVETAYRQPESMHSRVLRQEGSTLIHERVFSKILEAEEDTRTKSAQKDIDITPLNYYFSMVALEMCDSRPCYHLGLTPKHKDKFLLEGEIWIDGEDFAIVRIRGNPSKRPSFWTTSTQVDRRYKRVDGIWLTDRIESTSNIMIAGHSHLKIDYLYTEIHTGSSW